MVDLLNKIKGGVNLEDRGDKTAISEEHTSTWSKMLDFAGSGIAENAYRTLQSNNIYQNGDNFVVDEFVDVDGTNDTVNTGTTTAGYQGSNNYYALRPLDEATSDTTSDPDSFSNPGNAFDDNKTTSATKTISSATSASLGKTFGAKTLGLLYVRAGYNAGNPGARTLILQTFNGATWSNFQTLASATSATIFDEVIDMTSAGSIQGVRVILNNNSGNVLTMSLYSLEYTSVSLYRSNDILVIDSNTKTLDGTEQSLIIYGDSSIPTNTAITVDITDGTNTLSAQPLNEVIGLTGFSSGTLSITFNLSTTDTNVTPTISGYGTYIK